MSSYKITTFLARGEALDAHGLAFRVHTKGGIRYLAKGHLCDGKVIVRVGNLPADALAELEALARPATADIEPVSSSDPPKELEALARPATADTEPAPSSDPPKTLEKAAKKKTTKKAK